MGGLNQDQNDAKGGDFEELAGLRVGDFTTEGRKNQGGEFKGIISGFNERSAVSETVFRVSETLFRVSDWFHTTNSHASGRASLSPYIYVI